MSKKIKDGWYIAAASGGFDVSCVAFYWDAEIRKHIADAMKMLKRFNRVEGRFCTSLCSGAWLTTTRTSRIVKQTAPKPAMF